MQSFFCPPSETSYTHWVITFMSDLQKLIRNEDLTGCLTQGKELHTCIVCVEVAVVSPLSTIEALWRLCTARCIQAHWQAISCQLSVYPDGNSSHMLFKVVCLHVSDLMLKCSCSLCWQCTVKAASALHDRLFRRLLLSPMRFFDTTPLGRILTRFSRDMDEGEAWFVLTRNLCSPPEDFSVSEVTLVDKVYCWVHGLREWISVIHFTVVFVWLVDAFLCSFRML